MATIISSADVPTIRGLTGDVLEDETDSQVISDWRVIPIEKVTIRKYPALIDYATMTADEQATVRLALSYLVASSVMGAHHDRITQSRIGNETVVLADDGDRFRLSYEQTAYDLLAEFLEGESEGILGLDHFVQAGGRRGS